MNLWIPLIAIVVGIGMALGIHAAGIALAVIGGIIVISWLFLGA